MISFKTSLIFLLLFVLTLSGYNKEAESQTMPTSQKEAVEFDERYAEIQRLFNEGQQLLQSYNRNNYEQAISLFNRIIEMRRQITLENPFQRARVIELQGRRMGQSLELLYVHDPKVFFYRGLARARLGRNFDAIMDLSRAMIIIDWYHTFPADRADRQEIAEKVFRYSGTMFMEWNTPDIQIIQWYDLLPLINNPYIYENLRHEIYYHRGLVSLRLFRYEEGFADFDEAIRLNPRYVEIYFHREVAKIRRDIILHNNHYKELFQWNLHDELTQPFSVKPYFYRAVPEMALYLLGRNVDETVSISPFINSSDPLSYLSYLDFAIEEIIEDDPNHPYKNDIYYLQAVMLIKMENYDDALTTFDKIDPEDSRFHHRAFIVQLMNKGTEESEGAGACSPDPLM